MWSDFKNGTWNSVPGFGRRTVLVLFLLLSFGLTADPVAAQSNAGFDVRLVQDWESAEKTLALYEGISGNPADIARLRGSRIALATTELLAGRPLDIATLERNLADAKFGQTTDSVFRMAEARDHAAAIKELLTEMRRRNFGRRVVSTVEQLFPSNTKISTSIPVYYVAFGHHNIDAYVRRVEWNGNTPTFVGEGEGELTIVVNLAKGVYYGRTVDERFIGLLSVVAHEVFHAAFGVYKDTSLHWKEYNAAHQSYLDRLLALTQDEGVAHYLSFEQRNGDYLPPDWDQRVRASFKEFNRNASRLLSPTIPPHRAFELIRSSNTAGYWESYGAITGLFIARTIDRELGRAALAETLRLGPSDFYSTYAGLARLNNSLPTLAEEVLAVFR